MHERDRSSDELIRGIDAQHARVSGAHVELLRLIAEGDRQGVWRDAGARDMAHWLSMRQGISEWKARRWIAAAHALERLPRLSRALSSGELGIDKIVELARFATPGTEAGLLGWARGVSCACVRRRADLAARRSIEDAQELDRARSLSWWYFDEGSRFGLEAEFPAAQGAVVARALQRLADEIPVMPDEEDPLCVKARRADALLALCSARIANDADPDRATVVVHAQLEGAMLGESGCELEDGPMIHPETVRRLLCTARVQTVIEDEGREALALGRLTREPPAWMLRQLRYRDHGCTFPGCGARRFTQAHHIVWWRHGGTTDLANLVLVCSFHHKLVHEYGWRIERGAVGVEWYRPDGARHRAGPAPPREGERVGGPMPSTPDGSRASTAPPRPGRSISVGEPMAVPYTRAR